MPNSQVINALPQAAVSNGQYAAIATLDGSQIWKFLVMPTQITYDRSVSYGSSDTTGLAPSQQWVRTEGWNLSINNLPLSTYWEGKSLTGYVSAIADFQQPNGDDPPPPLLFKFGSRVFSPCVMTKFSKTERLWFPSGDLAEALISFTLIEVPISQVI